MTLHPTLAPYAGNRPTLSCGNLAHRLAAGGEDKAARAMLAEAGL